jgi:predicted nucleotidyltransferase
MPSQDYEEFIAALNAHGVRYLVIGAHAVAFHARPRATKDLDILLEPSAENAARVLAALKEFFGGADLGYTVEDLLAPHWIVQLGVAPVRIDLHAAIPGIGTFQAAWKHRVDARFGAVRAHFVGLEDLLRAKEAAGRPQDRADVRVLQRARERTRPAKRSSGRSRRLRR